VSESSWYVLAIISLHVLASYEHGCAWLKRIPVVEYTAGLSYG